MIASSKIWIFLYMLSTTYCDVCRNGCTQSRIKGLLGADCYDQNLREVPHCLSSSIEILDLSLNRIREISTDDLKPYSYIKILYLADNVITNISEESLRDKTDLHTLDLSYNVLYHIPKVIFHMTSLTKLYMSHVESLHMVEDIESSKPFESPLHYLDLSYNKLHRLPDLGVVPTLTKYNISGNKNMKLGAGSFAGLCNLETLVNEGCDSPRFESPCECWTTESWLKERNVNFSSFNCEQTVCSRPVSSEDLQVYNNCRKLHEEQMLRSFTSKLLTNFATGVAVISLVLIFTVIYVIRRRKQKKKSENVEVLS